MNLKKKRRKSKKINKVEILNAAAIFIQKNYRGYRIRRIVKELLNYKLAMEMIKNGEIQQLRKLGLNKYIGFVEDNEEVAE
jgi:hypothetical protein